MTSPTSLLDDDDGDSLCQLRALARPHRRATYCFWLGRILPVRCGQLRARPSLRDAPRSLLPPVLYVAWIIFLFNVTSFVFGERIKKFKAEAAKRRAPLKSATSLEEVTVSLPPPASVTKIKATSAFGVGQWERRRAAFKDA